MSSGYIIRTLRLTGPTSEPAEVRFKKGLNIISGPSNTGKTYIFQCINYMLGASQSPKDILEARNYAYCYLEIETLEAKIYTLKSDLRGGDFHLYEEPIDRLSNDTLFSKLARKHDDNEVENISQFLLNICQLKGKKVKLNANGKKRGLSYRDLVKLAMVDETKIITDKSPIVSGQYITDTVEKSVFKFLITGKDDSGLIEKLSLKEITHRKGKIEMLTDLIIGIDKDIAALNVQDFDDTQLERTEHGIANLYGTLSSLESVYKGLNEQRGDQYRQLAEADTAKNELAGVLERSNILEKQYDSDAARLLSTIEVCELLSNGSEDEGVKECPVCHNSISGAALTTNVLAVAEACKKEYVKINLLKTELTASQQILRKDIAEILSSIKSITASINVLNRQIDEQVQEKINDTLVSLEQLKVLNEQLSHYHLLNERRKSLVDSKNSIAGTISSKKKDASADNNLSSIIYPLTEQIRNILLSCHYPSLTTVSFNEDKVDFIISGQDRELTGKGYRAITYSAFIVALQTLLIGSTYSIGVPVLDSPFVTYRKPEAGDEAIAIDLAMDFYRYLAGSELSQVIIMENEEPPDDIHADVNHIVFTQSTEIGRYGFIPV